MDVKNLFNFSDTGQTGVKTGLIDIINTDCSKSVCEADVVLMQPLAARFNSINTFSYL